MKFHTKQILTIMILLNLAACAGYYLLFQNIKNQTKAALALTDTIESSQKKNSEFSSLRNIVKDTEAKRVVLDKYLLQADGEIQFIETIENLATENGLEVKTNSVSSVSVDTAITKIFQMQISTNGSWNNTINFLNKIENLPYNIRISALSIKLGAKGWNAIFDLSVDETK